MAWLTWTPIHTFPSWMPVTTLLPLALVLQQQGKGSMLVC